MAARGRFQLIEIMIRAACGRKDAAAFRGRREAAECGEVNPRQEMRT